MTQVREKPVVSRQLSGLHSRLQRVALSVTCSEERQAVERYSWPMTLRIAGYITVVSALGSALSNGAHPGIATAAGIVGLWFLYLLAFAVLTQNHVLNGLGPRLGLFALQIGCGLTLQHLSLPFASELLFYMLAAEIQFLVPFRLALGVTVGLWILLATTESILAPANLQLHGIDIWLITPAGFAFVAAFTRGAVTELVQRQRADRLVDQLHEAHARLRDEASQAEQLAVAQERNRLARDIHDTLGHYLTVINVQIEAAQKMARRDPERSEAALATAKQLATECLNEVRRSVGALRPAALEDLDFSSAVARLIEETRRGADLTVSVQVRGDGVLPPAAEDAAYRLIQECLTNIRKHAAAQHIWLTLDWQRQTLDVTVRDDGRGAVIRPDGPGGSFGLRGMRERLQALGGRMDVRTAPGEGFTVVATIPYQGSGTPALQRTAV